MEYPKAKISSCMLRATLTFTVMTSRSILTTIEKMTCSLLASSPRNHRLNSETSQTISSMTLRCSFPPAPSLYIILFLKTGIKENVHLKPDYKCHCMLVIYITINYFYTNIANVTPYPQVSQHQPWCSTTRLRIDKGSKKAPPLE